MYASWGPLILTKTAKSNALNLNSNKPKAKPANAEKSKKQELLLGDNQAIAKYQSKCACCQAAA
jgi:hypothetical protein